MVASSCRRHDSINSHRHTCEIPYEVPEAEEDSRETPIVV
jgi:hypothetical protein